MNNELIEDWKNRSETKTKQLTDFLKELKYDQSGSIDPLATEFHDQVFEEIDCLDCANCCKTTPAVLLKSDIKRISRYLKIAPKLFIKKHVIEDINGELSFRKVPCVFLEPDNRCSVYEVRPEACQDYPHTRNNRFIRRKKLHKANLGVCPAVYHILDRMDRKSEEIEK